MLLTLIMLSLIVLGPLSIYFAVCVVHYLNLTFENNRMNRSQLIEKFGLKTVEEAEELYYGGSIHASFYDLCNNVQVNYCEQAQRISG